MTASFLRWAALPAALMLALTACREEEPSGEATPSSSLIAPRDAAAAASAPANADALPEDESFDTATVGLPDAVLEVATPTDAAVLDAIYGSAQATSASSADSGRVLPDGRIAAFWRGQVFALDGAGWYVGLATSASPSESPAPGDTVELGQATWRFADGAWQPVSTSSYIGRFGGAGRAPPPDGAQDVRVHAGEGRVLLAVPTETAANAGIVVYAYELFLAEGEPLAWRHAGRLPAGSDNRAGCSDVADSPMPCASAAGTLEFVTADAASGAVASAGSSDWPTLRLALQGTVVIGPGQVRGTTPEDVVELRFDAESGQYQPARPIPEAAL